MSTKKININKELHKIYMLDPEYRYTYSLAINDIMDFMRTNGKCQDDKFISECIDELIKCENVNEIKLYIISFFKKQGRLGMIVDIDKNLHRTYMLDPEYSKAYYHAVEDIMDFLLRNNKSKDDHIVSQCRDPLIKCKNVKEIKSYLIKFFKKQVQLGMIVEVFEDCTKIG